MNTERICLQCGSHFTVRYPSIVKNYCSRTCRNRRMSEWGADRTSESNPNWGGGKTKHPLYDIYLDMVGRCHRETHARYESYGGRGITVCARWRADFWAFVADMGPRPGGSTSGGGRALYSLDRVDNDGDYDPANCRWATPSEQSKNRRRTAYPQALRTSCSAGHEYTPETLHISREGKRRCRTCERKRAVEARQRRAAS